MYGGKEIFTKESLLNSASEYRIFKYYCSNFQEIGKRFKSDLRLDKNPSCVIYNTKSGLIYKDFGDNKSLDCFNYVKEYLKVKLGLEVNFNELLNIIGNDLKLIKNIKNIIPPSANYIGLADKYDKTSRVIRIKSRNWNKTDCYWDDYYIGKNILKYYNVTPLSHLWISSKVSDELHLIYEYNKNIFDPAYAYDHFNGQYKVLRPYAEDLTLNKWISNIPRTILSGWEQLDNQGETLIVTKSLKDCMGWRLFGYNAVSPQSESIFMNENTFELLKYRFTNIIINYDNDKAGLYTMEKVKEQFNIKRFIFHSSKDISDSLYFKGFEHTKKLIQNLNNNLF